MDPLEPIKRKIYEIRGRRVMLDSDLAGMYQVETKNLKRAVRANIERFPDDFMFELTKDEYDSLRCKNFTSNNDCDTLRCKNFTSNKRGGNRYLPFVFTREGIAMLSGLLRSEIAIQANINIMRAFFQMQEALLIVSNTQLQLEQIRSEIRQLQTDMNDILADQNDINESTRAQLDAISTALSELQAKEPRKRERNPIGFIKPEKKAENTPPSQTKRQITYFQTHTPMRLSHQASYALSSVRCLNRLCA